MYDVIKLSNFRTSGIVGWLAIEQQTPQPIDVEIELHLDLSSAADQGDLSQTVDYAAVQSQVVMLVSSGSWRLIETVATAISRLLLSPPGPDEERAVVQEVTVRVSKPAILAGGIPSVRIHRTGEWCDLGTRMEPPSTWVDVLAETANCGAYRLHVEPGSTFMVPAGVALEVIAGAPDIAGRPYGPGERLPSGMERSVANHGDAPLTLLAISSPPAFKA